MQLRARHSQCALQLTIHRWQLECTAALATELDRTAIIAVDGVGGGQAAHGILAGHLAGGDAPGLEDLLSLGHNQGALARQSLLSLKSWDPAPS